MPLACRLIASARPRGASRLDGCPWPDVPDPEIAALVARWPADPPWGAVTISGAEPTTRPDLPELIAALAASGAPDLGMSTDGLALVSPHAVGELVRAGLRRVRIALHSVDSAAHDWLVGIDGAAARGRRAVRICEAEGLVVEVEIAITRPTAARLADTLEVAAALGARAVHLRRVRPARDQEVALTPRLGLLAPRLQAAVVRGRQRGLAVHLHDLPACAAPGVHDGSDGEAWVFPSSASWQRAAAWQTAATARGCDDCPASCRGAPADYTRIFGWTEFTGAAEAPAGGPDVPPGRGGGRPTTRLAPVLARARSGPPVGGARGTIRCLEVPLPAAGSTRDARLRLVRAAEERPEVLRLVGGWTTHPRGLALIAETRWLCQTTEVVGSVAGWDAVSEAALAHLGHLAALRIPLARPVVDSETRQRLERLARAGVAASVAGRVRDAAGARGFLDAWGAGRLPGTPALCLDPHADVVDLEELRSVDHPAVAALWGAVRFDDRL